MTTFDVVEGKRWHCGMIARSIRREHEKSTRSLGLKTHDGITLAYVMSSIVRTWRIDGKVAALGGVMTSMVSDEAAVWVAISEEATRYPVAMFKTALAAIEELAERKRIVRTTVVLGDRASFRFAERLGFRLHAKPLGEDIIVMELRRGGTVWPGQHH